MRFKINGINPGLTFAVLTLLITTIGCSSGGGSVNPSTNTPLTGVFLDSPVDGLGYETDTIQGVTGPGGVFSYHSGESIRFFIGDIELGTTEAMPIITPIDCVEGAIDETDPMVTNMLIFLQSIDFDNDPENGIDITHPTGHYRRRWTFRRRFSTRFRIPSTRRSCAICTATLPIAGTINWRIWTAYG